MSNFLACAKIFAAPPTQTQGEDALGALNVRVVSATNVLEYVILISLAAVLWVIFLI